MSFLQVPSWAGVKAKWGSLSIGWFDDDQIVGGGSGAASTGSGGARYFAYPEGPSIDWPGLQTPETLHEWLDLMLAFPEVQGARRQDGSQRGRSPVGRQPPWKAAVADGGAT